MLETFLLEQLDAFARTGTLSKAAEELHITQPALSRNMKKLEDIIGVPLFDRAGRKISLNETGRVAARYARQTLEANQKTIEMTRAFDLRHRAVVVGSSSVLSLNDVLRALRSRFPERNFVSELVEESALLAGLHNHAFHLAVLHGQPHDRGLYSRRLFKERLCVSVPSGHVWAVRDSITFAELNGTNIISSVGTGRWHDIVQQHVRTDNLVVQQNLTTLAELIDSSSMPTFWSDRMAQRGFEQTGRVLVPIADDDALAVYYLACLANKKRYLDDLLDQVTFN